MAEFGDSEASIQRLIEEEINKTVEHAQSLASELEQANAQLQIALAEKNNAQREKDVSLKRLSEIEVQATSFQERIRMLEVQYVKIAKGSSY